MKIISLAVLLAYALLISSCNYGYETTDSRSVLSMRIEYFSDVRFDRRLFREDNCKPYYISDDLIFYVNERLSKCFLGSPTETLISSSSLTITSPHDVTIDYQKQLLYFTALNHNIDSYSLFKCDFMGQSIDPIGSATTESLRAPMLSGCGNYISMIRNGMIYTVYLPTGSALELGQDIPADVAVFDSESASHYYYTHDETYKSVNLCRSSGGAEMALIIFNTLYSGQYTDFKFSRSISTDRNYFGLLMMPKNASSYEQASTLKYYSLATGNISEIQDCNFFTFAPQEAKLFYGSDHHGMADLWCLNLEDNSSELIWDGYVTNSRYSLLIENMYIRSDGEYLYLSAKTRHRDKNHNPNDSEG